ncbi:hypothetical protein VN97_g4850 [Penicillium thymicola]|uniref:Uncharacterized protein n=1 Tax=Penicillium thymicola TaxID=293382 RepID=A0AAI9TJW6_PENTH|nr:hypothetical protein VN97_g4850 [Penicillium thymicola]
MSLVANISCIIATSLNSPAGLAQSVERKTLNLKAAGSTPAFGYSYKPILRFLFFFSLMKILLEPPLLILEDKWLM